MPSPLAVALFSGLLLTASLGARNAFGEQPVPDAGSAPANAAAPAPATPTQADLDGWWADLAKEEPSASHALLQFSAHPGEATAYFQKHLQPLTLTRERLHDLLIDLGSDDEAIWKSAFNELDYFDPRLAVDLETLMKEAIDTPARQPLVEVLSGLEAGSLGTDVVELIPTGEGTYTFRWNGRFWWAEHRVDRLRCGNQESPKRLWERAVRAILLLDFFQTPEATALLKSMASGHSDAEPTIVAKGALERIHHNTSALWGE